jgi:hypothetical protein
MWPNAPIAASRSPTTGRSKTCCHICGHTEPVPAVCPKRKCRNPAIRYAGLGTERSSPPWPNSFPHARTVRMDSDTLKRKEDYRRILGDFRVGKIDILVGTQMIAKGLHFPNVTLVGIIYADLAPASARFPRGRADLPIVDTGGRDARAAATSRARCSSRPSPPFIRPFNSPAGTTSRASTSRRWNFRETQLLKKTAGLPGLILPAPLARAKTEWAASPC